MMNEFRFDYVDLKKDEDYTFILRDTDGKRITTGFGYGSFQRFGHDNWSNTFAVFHDGSKEVIVYLSDIVGDGPPAEYFDVEIRDD
jgi:hypothetical protein